MQEQNAHTFARRLFDRMGHRAEAYVAQKIEELDKASDDQGVADWQRVRRAMQIIRQEELRQIH
ncbi:hypothetical protein [Pseudokordiimonas caeni]|uniref:hypothetical protein n=1 Tax=Pseudokordiimonas caeni TaxID=2997908 RepID=UPI002810AD0E|nr:hypothetical protein [Pseudokordiimonas caeni]